MATNYKAQKFNEYMKQIRNGKIVTIYREDLDEIEQRAKQHGMRLIVTFIRNYVNIRRK